MRTLVFCLILFVANSASAMTYFLVNQWYSQGNQMCQYGDGTVLNVGVRICPLSIQN